MHIPAALWEVEPEAFAGCEKIRVAEVEQSGGTTLRIRETAPDAAIVVETIFREDRDERIAEQKAKDAEMVALKKQL